MRCGQSTGSHAGFGSAGRALRASDVIVNMPDERHGGVNFVSIQWEAKQKHVEGRKIRN